MKVPIKRVWYYYVVRGDITKPLVHNLLDAWHVLGHHGLPSVAGSCGRDSFEYFDVKVNSAMFTIQHPGRGRFLKYGYPVQWKSPSQYPNYLQ